MSATTPRPMPTRSATCRRAILALGVATIGFTLSIGSPAAAETVTIDPLAPALNFNAFIHTDTTLTSTEMEGPLATGGDLSIEGSYNIAIHDPGTFIDDGDAQPSALVVGGHIDYDQDPGTSAISVLNDGYVKVGDLTGTEVLNTDDNGASANTRLVASGDEYDSTPRVQLTTQEPAESVGPASPIDFDAAFDTFRDNAAALYACENTVTMTRPDGTAVPKGEVQPGDQIHVELETGATNVLNVTGEDLNNLSEIDFDTQPDANTPLLVNVDTSGTGGIFDWTVAPQAGISGDQAPYILWNLPDTTDLTLVGGDTLEGSIYAPQAAFTDLSAANVEGQVVAQSARLGSLTDNGGETHYFPFAAELSCETEPDPDPTDSPSPEVPTVPATDHADGLPVTGTSLTTAALIGAALIAGGIATLMISRRRRSGN